MPFPTFTTHCSFYIQQCKTNVHSCRHFPTFPHEFPHFPFRTTTLPATCTLTKTMYTFQVKKEKGSLSLSISLFVCMSVWLFRCVIRRRRVLTNYIGQSTRVRRMEERMNCVPILAVYRLKHSLRSRSSFQSTLCSRGLS